MKKNLFAIFTFLLIASFSFAQNTQLDKAKELATKGQYSQAKKIYLQILAANPVSAPALNGLGNVYAMSGKLDSAVYFYNKAAELNYPDALFNLGKYYFKYQSDTRKSLEYLTRAHNLSPDSAGYALFLGIVYQAEGKMDTAITYYKEVMAKSPDNAYPYYFISEYLYERDSLQMAYEFVNEAIKRNDKNYNFFDLKSSIEFKAGMYKEALESINQALALKDLPKLKFRKAKILYALGNYSQVIDMLEPMKDDAQLGLNARYFLAWAYYNTGQYNLALKTANNALAKDPNIAEFYELLAYTYLKTGDYKKAGEAADQLIALSPDYYQAYTLKVNARLRQRTPDGVLDNNGYFALLNIKHLDEVKMLLSDRKSQYYYKNLMNKFSQSPAELSIDQYFMLYVGYGLNNKIERYDSKNFIRPFGQGDYVTAINEAQKAIEQYPLDVAAYLYLANSYLKTGDKDKFIENLTIYHGIMKGISASGTGTSTENAYIITHRDDEYYLIDYTLGNPQRALNFGIKQTEKNGLKFEVIEIGFRPGQTFQVFFYNIAAH